MAQTYNRHSSDARIREPNGGGVTRDGWVVARNGSAVTRNGNSSAERQGNYATRGRGYSAHKSRDRVIGAAKKFKVGPKIPLKRGRRHVGGPIREGNRHLANATGSARSLSSTVTAPGGTASVALRQWRVTRHGTGSPWPLRTPLHVTLYPTVDSPPGSATSVRWSSSGTSWLQLGCPLHPRKLPRLSASGAAAKGHERPHAPQQWTS